MTTDAVRATPKYGARPHATGGAARGLVLLLSLLLSLAGGLLLGISVVRPFKTAVDVDQSWYLYAAGRLMHGATLYSADLMDTNPPFIIWLSTIPNALAKLLRIAPLNAFRIFYLALALGSVAWCTGLFRTLTGGRSRLLLWFFVIADGYFSLMSIAPVDWGQREHFVFLGLLPYLMAAALRVRQLRSSVLTRISIGVAGVFAVCCKPQHALDIVAIELALLLITRRVRLLLRPELVTALLGCVLYVLAIWTSSRSYITAVIPLLRDVYWAFGLSWAEMLPHLRDKAVLPAISLVVYVFARRYLSRAHLALVDLADLLMVSGTAALLVFALQRTGWNYQAIPAESFFGLALVMMLGELLIRVFDEASAAPSPVWCLSISLLVAVASAGYLSHRMRQHPLLDPPKVEVQHVFSQYPPGTPVYYMTSMMSSAAAVEANGLILGSRYPHQWLVPAIILNEYPKGHPPRKRLSAGRLAEISQLARLHMAQDLNRWQPVVVVVSPCPEPEFCNRAGGHAPDLLEWFSDSPEFRKAWSQYAFERQQSEWLIFIRKGHALPKVVSVAGP